MKRIVRDVTPDLKAKIVLKTVERPSDEDLGPEEVMIKIEATPINPSDLLVLLPGGCPKNVHQLTGDERGVEFAIPEDLHQDYRKEVGKEIPIGNEGAGVVIKTGSSEQAKALMNKIVSVRQRGNYAQVVRTNIANLLIHNEGTTSKEAASSIVNPVTVACMIDNVRRDNHKAIVQTAAASQLGQMMVKICLHEKIPLVNIVRSESQEKILLELGAKYIVRSDKESFMEDLIQCVDETEATVAFDAIGGGPIVGQLITAMETAARTHVETDVSTLNVYGTPKKKQIYVYGALDPSPTTFTRWFGFKWDVSGWLLPNYLSTVTAERRKEIFKFVADHIKTIFKTDYYKEITLEEMVDKEILLQYAKQETGKKFLVLPNH